MNIFNDVPDKSVEQSSQQYGQSLLPNVNSIQIGAGAKAFKGDSSGIWLGANKFADAPFKVDLDGNIYMQSTDGKLVLDATNNRIVIYDASSVPRVLLGYQLNGF